jgi:TRAP-type C4-dicarboxylate transport system permease small subunit
MASTDALTNKTKMPFGLKWLVEDGTAMAAFVGACGIIMVALVVVLDVLMRWLFNAPIFGVDDLCIYILAVSVSCFFPIGLAKGHFVTVRILGKSLGDRFAKWFEVFGAVCTLGFFVILVWRLILYSIMVTQSGLATVVLQFRQAPWWWIVTSIMIICIPVQSFVLILKFRLALSGNSPGQTPDASLGKNKIGQKTPRA